MHQVYGLIGKKLSHSFSPEYFSEKFRREGIDAEYRLFELERVSQLPGLLSSVSGLRGLNVTVPYKREVIPFLDELDDVARETGSVNCIRIENNRLSGFNTDVEGFEQSLLPLLKGKTVSQALILGTGGAAQAVAYVLRKRGIAFRFVSRNPQSDGQLAYKSLDKSLMENSTLIVNATPVGMFPRVNDFPSIPYEWLTSNHLLYDLVYNPEQTVFLSKGKMAGATVCNGLNMLHLQAEAAWRIWTSS